MGYGESIETVFPARADGRTAAGQGGYQMAALGVTLVTSLAGGVLTGFIIKAPCFLYHGPVHEGEEDKAKLSGCCELMKSQDERVWYDDKYYWEVPSDGEEEHHNTIVPVPPPAENDN